MCRPRRGSVGVPTRGAVAEQVFEEVIETRSPFPNQEAAMKLPVPGAGTHRPKWAMTVENWKAASRAL